MVTGPELTSPRAARVRAAQRLAKRAFRARDRRFLAEGPQAVREALARAAARSLELFATRDAADAARRRSWPTRRRGGIEVHAGQRRGDGRAVPDRDAAGPGRGLRPARPPARRAARLPAAAGRRARPRPRPRQRRHRHPDRRRGRRRRRPAHRRQRRPLQRQVRPRLGRQPVPPAGRHRRPGRATTCPRCRPRGLRVLAADGHADRRPRRGARRRACSTGRPPGCSATRRGACPRRPGRWPTPSSRSRSTAGPSR